MKSIILGSAAGGGSPQWNCRCPVCALFWNGDPRVRRRTQSSVAVSADQAGWVLLNCSPDVREQIGACPFLQPRHSPRQSPIVSVVLTNGDVDHIGGLLNLRESHRFSVWAPAAVIDQIQANPIFGVLSRELVAFHAIRSGVPFSPAEGLSVEAFDVPGKVPLYREGQGTPEISRNGQTLGLHVRHDGHTLSYVPGCGAIDETLLADLEGTDTLLFDGTLWTDDEMLTTNTGVKTGRRMGHVPVSGDDGSMAGLAALPAKQRIFIHLNNTNPLLVDGCQEAVIAKANGWRVAFDGMEIVT